MAKPPAAYGRSSAGQTPDEKLKQEALRRIKTAKEEKQHILPWLEEAYFFTAPDRRREQNSDQKESTPRNDQNELQGSLGFELAADFATLLCRTRRHGRRDRCAWPRAWTAPMSNR
jgi:hypothetical protein